MTTILRNACRCFFLFLACFFLFLLLPLAVRADGGAPNLAYVAGTSQGISAIDVGQQKVTNTISVSGDPHTILLSLDGRYLYVTQPALGRVAVIATGTKQIVCAAHLSGQPSLLAFDSNRNMLYAAGNGAATVSAIDPTNCDIKHTYPLGDSVSGLAVAVNGSDGSNDQLWVADTNSLTVFDLSGKRIAEIPIDGGPQYVCIPAGVTAYITTRSGSVEAVNMKTRKVMPLLSSGLFGPMDYSAISGEVYVPDEQHDLVNVLTPVNWAVATPPSEPGHVIRLGVSPRSIAITSDGQLGFVVLNTGNVVMLDIPGRQVINTIYVGGTPHFIITGLYPSVFGLTGQQVTFIGVLSNIAHYALAGTIVLFALFLVLRQRRLNRLNGPESDKFSE